MKKRRLVSIIFAAVATFAASAISFTPTDNSTVLYKEGSFGEQIFVGEADSANINLAANDAGEITDIQLVSGTDTAKVTGSTIKIGTYKCYSLLYSTKITEEKKISESAYLCYVKKQATAPTVKVCAFDSVKNPICNPSLKVKFFDLTYANSYINAKLDTVLIKDNIVLSYLDYESEGLTIKDKAMEVVVNGTNKDTTLLIQKPKRNTVFKLKDKFSQYEYITDTFYTPLLFSTAQITIEGESIPHNTESRGEEELVFGTLDEAKENVSKYMFSGPLDISIERNSVDNAPIDTVITVNPDDSTKTDKTLVPVDARYTWKFYNDSTAKLNSSYRIRYNDLSLSQEHIDEFGTHFVVLECDNSVCKDTLYAGFKVKTSYLLMPSVFTPNGDGYNDEFRPTYTSINEYKIWIYNTMGKKVYDSEDITVGWDGTNKGHECPIGAYYYVVKATGVDGTEYKLKGTINLVRNAED